MVAAYDDGELLGEERVELTEGSGGRVDLPGGHQPGPGHPAPHGGRRVAWSCTRDRGATVVPLRELVRYPLIPDVRPGLP